MIREYLDTSNENKVVTEIKVDHEGYNNTNNIPYTVSIEYVYADDLMRLKLIEDAQKGKCNFEPNEWLIKEKFTCVSEAIGRYMELYVSNTAILHMWIDGENFEEYVEPSTTLKSTLRNLICKER